MTRQVNRNQYQGLYTQDITAKVSATIPSLATQVGGTVVVTVTGAAVGDHVTVIPQFNQTGLIVSGFVNAANSVTITADNVSGSTVNLGAQTFFIRVSRPNAGLYT